MTNRPRSFPISDDSAPRISRRPAPRGRPFAAGNPGRPKGSRNKLNRMREALHGGNEDAVRELAALGDVHALAAVIESHLILRVATCATGKRRPEAEGGAAIREVGFDDGG